MTSNRAPLVLRCDRSSLRDVQNEISALEPGQSVKANKGTITSSDPNRSGNKENSEWDSPFRSFTCTGAEVELSDPHAVLQSEESILITALTAQYASQTLSNSAVIDETQTVEHSSEHEDHPYCTNPTDEATPADLTFKSFTCPGGEIEVVSDSALQEPIVAKYLGLLSVEELSEGNTQLPSHHIDHLYCQCQTEEDDKYEIWSENAIDVTFKSFTCPGGEIEIPNESLLQESIINKDLYLENQPQIVEEISEGHTELLSQNVSRQEDKKAEICSENAGNVTFKSFSCPGEEIELLGKDLEQENQSPSSEELSEGHTKLPSQNLSTQEDKKDETCLKDAPNLTFKSFTCPGGEIEIPNESFLKESIVNEDPELENPSLSVEEPSEGHTELPSQHFDHLYCHLSTQEDKKDEIRSENAVDVTFIPFTSPEGEIEVPNETLLQESIVVKDLDLEYQSESVEEISGGHKELLRQNLSTQEDKKDEICLNVAPNVTFKSFICPGGEIEIPNESALLESIVADDLDLESPSLSVEELSEGHTELPTQHFDHLYSQSTRTSPPKLNGSICTPSLVGHGISEDPAPNLNLSTASESQNGSSTGSQARSDQHVSSEVNPNPSTELKGVNPAPSRVTAGLEEGSLDNTSPNPANPKQCSSEAEKQGSGSALDFYNTQISGNITEKVLEKCSNTESDALFPPKAAPEAQNVQDHGPNASLHHDPEILRSETQGLQMDISKLWSEITLLEPSSPKNSSLGHLWLPESPFPPPRLNSTELHPAVTPQRGADLCAVGSGPLQEQLRKMAELLIAASGKIAAPAAVVQRRSACVWTSPPAQRERSTNTSAVVEEQKEQKEVSDACTATDPLLWSVSRSNLESLSRSELEQKLISTLIMVEVLSQQLASAQNQNHNARVRTGPNPSSLRDRLVQTERTELSQTGPYRELYVTALDRIRTLEEDQEALHTLHQAMQLTHTAMMSVKAETLEALCSMKQLEATVTDDHEILSKQKRQVKALYARCMDTLKKMEQKNRVCVKDREDMKRRMEEALDHRATVLRVLEQLRAHHTEQISDLQHSLGSHEELTASLTHTYPKLVELNKMCMESLTAANTLLRDKLDDHTHLSAELHKAQNLLQRTNPVLQKLHQRAASALKQSQRYQEERDRALEDQQQMEQRLYEAQSSLQEADQQITDLNTQITIMNSEMAVLREQLGEVEDERAQLQRKATELSATVSSTLASYSFLEQALTSETSKLQRSLHDTQEATERADSLQGALQVCERRVEQLEQVLQQKEDLLTKLSSETESQRLQLRRLTQIQSELSNTREMSEFLQAENELTREQLAESEGLLRSHLQGLRERNLECEDLRVELHQLCEQRECLQQELLCTRDKARLLLLEQGEQIAQATLDSAVLLQRVCALRNSIHTNHKSSDPPAQDDPPAPQPCSSFLNSVMQALTEKQPCDTTPTAPSNGTVEEQDLIETISSRTSAFTRVAPNEPQTTDVLDRPGSAALLDLLSSVSESVSELHSAIEQLKLHKDAEIHDLQRNIRDLQEATEGASSLHRAGQAELKHQVDRLKAQVERETQVIHQKAQDEKALRKLCSELEEKVEAAQKQRAENSELRREGAELRRELRQAQVEVQALRAELTRTAGQSAGSVKELNDRIRLLREVERLKASLSEVEESRSKLLERAKRHQMVHAINQSKLERELHLLDDMIEAVRKALSSVPDVVNSCPELQKLVEFLG